ncbi:MAG TPA: protein kinase [Bacteroidota bacterium]|nr:protein kinase [Bacteroidota bacterium]
MIGSSLSHYEILELLGEGGMGVVYKARDTRLGRLVALKILPPVPASSPESVARFEQEAKTISALNHPHIATLHDAGESGGKRFLVLELIPGGTLDAKLRSLRAERKQIPLDDVISIGRQVSEALEHAHARGVIHRDVKPGNVMIAEGGAVKVTDFGLARLRSAERLTRPGSAVGTVAYMSPEQLRGEEATPGSDIFSLGVLLYEILTNSLPFKGDHEAALMYSIVNEEPSPIGARREGVPPELARVIMRCLEKEPSKRYQTAGDVGLALASLRGAEPAHSGKSARKTLRVPLIAVGALAAAGLALFLLIPALRPSPANGKTIAVLPFVNMSGDPQDEYFSDGMTEDILTQLSKIAELKVISRTSVMQYKGTTKTIPRIASELNAGVVLEGSVRHSSGQVRIAAQLIDARTDELLWGETYDKEFTQVFAIQSDVALKIAAALKARLSPEDNQRLGRHFAGSAEAYGLLLQAKYWRDRPGRDNFRRAHDYLNQALLVDSLDARVWACVSTVYAAEGDFGYFDANISYEHARAAASRALALDGTLADAHSAMGRVLMAHDFDWTGADGEFHTALALDPGNTESMMGAGTVARALGRGDEAEALYRKGVELDPLNLRFRERLGEMLLNHGRFGESGAIFGRGLEIEPGAQIFHGELSMIALFAGRIDSALAEAVREPDEGMRLECLALAYYAGGRAVAADSAVALLITGYAGEFAYQVAAVYAWRGMNDKAFAWLDRAYRQRDTGLLVMKEDLLLQKLRTDPRWETFLRRMHFV